MNNTNKILITACAILAALCVTAQQQDMRRGGSGSGGVSVAAGDRVTAVTNGSVVTLSADVQLGGGLFLNGVTNVSITNMTSLASYNGKLIVNSSEDAASSLQLLTQANDGLAAGSYFYVYYPSATIGGAVSAEPGAQVTRFGSGLNIGGQYALVKCYKTSTTNWHVEGDLTVP